MPKPLQPNFVLDVEASELFIQAGLQDRVIQVVRCCTGTIYIADLGVFMGVRVLVYTMCV